MSAWHYLQYPHCYTIFTAAFIDFQHFICNMDILILYFLLLMRMVIYSQNMWESHVYG
jgi:hypothetical protein